MLQTTTGNLIDLAEQGMFDIIVHGCNCQNVMGSGIAKEIRERYPLAYEADCVATRTWPNPVAKLGNFSTLSTAGIGHPFIIINAYTQVNFLPRGVDHFEYAAFEVILRKLLDLSPARFGFPLIGQGLAGGDGERIMALLHKFAEACHDKGSTVTVVHFQPANTKPLE